MFSPPTPEIKFLETADDISEAKNWIARRPSIGVDIETTGPEGAGQEGALDPRLARIRLVQFGTRERVYILDAFRTRLELLGNIFATGPTCIGHYLSFDIAHLWMKKIPFPKPADTFIAEHLLLAGLLDANSERRRGYFSLGNVVLRRLGFPLNKALQVSDWSGELSPEQYKYAADDVAVLDPLFTDILYPELEKAGLLRTFSLEMRTLPSIVWMGLNGAKLDAKHWEEIAIREETKSKELERLLDSLVLDEVGVRTLYGPLVPMKWSSPDNIFDYLTEIEGLKVPDTNEEHIIPFAPQSKIITPLLAYRETMKKTGTYGLDFLKHIHPVTGRIHANWIQVGPATGRMACDDPNLTNVIKGEHRTCFVADEGNVLVKTDFSQIELRIVAALSNEPTMLRAYTSNPPIDLHRLTASAILHKRPEDVTKEERQIAKAVNFGLIYGMGAGRLQMYAAKDYGVTISLEEAGEARRAFFEMYRDIVRWQRRTAGADIPIESRTLIGRRRLDVDKYSEKLNNPVQGSAGDGMKAAAALLWERRARAPKYKLILIVHDEAVVECAEEDAAEVKAHVEKCLKDGMGSFLTTVPVEVESTVGKSWGKAG